MAAEDAAEPASETASARTQTSNFENDPTIETLTIDPYSPAELTAITAPAPLEAVTSDVLEESVPEAEIANLEADEELLAELEAENKTLPQLAAKLDSDLPPGLDLKQTTEAGLSLKDLNRDLERIKSRISKGDGEYKPDMTLKSLKFMKKANDIVDIDAYKKLVDKGDEFGFDFKDEVTESSFTLSVMDGVMEAASDTNIWSYIEDTPLGDKFTDWFVDESIELAAKKGSYTSVLAIIQNNTKLISDTTRRKCMKLLFKNYRLKDENLDGVPNTSFDEPGYRTAAKRVVDVFDAILPDWEELTDDIGDLKIWTFGNTGLLTLLSHHTTTNPATAYNPVTDGTDTRNINAAAIIQFDNRYRPLPVKEQLAEAQPTVL